MMCVAFVMCGLLILGVDVSIYQMCVCVVTGCGCLYISDVCVLILGVDISTYQMCVCCFCDVWFVDIGCGCLYISGVCVLILGVDVSIYQMCVC